MHKDTNNSEPAVSGIVDSLFFVYTCVYIKPKILNLH